MKRTPGRADALGQADSSREVQGGKSREANRAAHAEDMGYLT